MDTVLCIHQNERFIGIKYFNQPDLLESSDIAPSNIQVPDITSDALEDIKQQYPEDEVDAILIHKLDSLLDFISSGAYSDTPLFVAGHVVYGSENRRRQWEAAVESGREIYLFVGSVRAGRSFHVPGADNLQIVIAPIMGLSRTSAGHLSDNFSAEFGKEYDIGFFSALTLKKRPHQVLETAEQVAKRLGRPLKVWIAGLEPGTRYDDFLETLVDSSLYPHLEIDYKAFLRDELLYEHVQKSRVMYLPLLKPSETTCYAAWEVVSYDVPIVGSDWAGVGEAIRHSRNPLSAAVPVKYIDSMEGAFSEDVIDEYPELVGELTGTYCSRPLMIDEEKAQQAIIDVLETDEEYTREFEVPERVHYESTVNAFKDIMNEVVEPEGALDAGLVETTFMDVVKTSRGYSLIQDPLVDEAIEADPYTYQTSKYETPN